MNILSIGNSFSQDATRYLHRIARSDGSDITTVNLYIGGCSLDRHFRNIMTDKRAYSLEINGEQSGFFVSVKEALTNREWDIITLQQVSHKSIDYATYQPYLDKLAEYVRTYCPCAKLYIHQTWPYEEDSKRLCEELGYSTSAQMLEDIKTSYTQAAKAINAFETIRSGELMYSLAQNGLSPVYRDTFHASLGAGRLALGLLWYALFTGNDIEKNTFCDTDIPVSAKQIDIIKKCIMLILDKKNIL